MNNSDSRSLGSSKINWISLHELAEVMAKWNSLIVAIFLILNTASFSWCACILLNDCPIAVKYIEKRRNDPETRKLLQNAHCGFTNRGRIRDPMVHCESLPDFADLPEGCVKHENCPQAMHLIQNRKYDPDVMSLLRSSACGYNNRKDMIICNRLTPNAAMTYGRKFLVNKTECGLQMPSGKIHGGQKAEFEDFPWLALFKYKNESGHVAYRCHGTLINLRYVISAAHCFKHTSAERRKLGNLETIVLGEYDITTEQDCLYSFGKNHCTDPLQEFSPESIHIHPKFLSSDGFNDIALVRLNKNAIISDFVKPICIQLQPLILKTQENLLIGGWGKTEYNQTSSVKLKGTIQHLPKSNCLRYNIDKTQVCAGSFNGIDTCKGDSGGPLMALRRYEDGETRTVLAGIVSYGSRCGSGSAVYTNINFFINWILNTIHE